MWKRSFRIFSSILVLVLIATTVSGCSLFGSNTPSAPKIFTIWGFDDEDVWKPVIKDAQKELSGYDIKYVKKSLNDSYENDALNSILSGQGPDIWAIPNDWVYRHKAKLAPMPDDVIKSATIKIDDQFVPAIKDSGDYDSKIYALSPVCDTLMVYYNSKIFEATLEEFNNNHKGEANQDARKSASKLLSQVPVTWNDFVESSKLLTKKSGNTIIQSGVALGTTNNVARSQDILYALMLQNGTQMVSSDMKLATFNLPVDNNEPAKKALDFYTSFSNSGSANYSWNATMPSDVEAFVQGKVAMIFGNEALANYFAQIYPDFRFTKAPLPQIGGTNDSIVDYAQYITYAVPALSANSATAWKVIANFATVNGSEYANTVKISSSAKKNNFQPALKDREGNNNPGSLQTQTAKVWNKGRYPKNDDAIFREAIDNVITGKQDSKSALDLAASKITDLLRKENW